jgi:hypothetical protein
VNWENTLFLKVNKYLSTTIGTMLIYDDNISATDNNGQSIGPRVQFKEVLSVGFAYKFSN